MRPRVVLDANVLVPGFVSGGSASSRLIDLWRKGEFELIVSAHLLGEVERAYDYPYYARRLDADQVRRILEILRDDAFTTVLTEPVVGVATQSEDDLVLSTAISGHADYLATRDRQLLRLDRFQGVLIVHPVDLLQVLEKR